MAEEYQLKKGTASEMEELGRFMERVNREIRYALRLLREEEHETSSIFETLVTQQEKLKARFEEVIKIAFDTGNDEQVVKRMKESKEGIGLVKALCHFFWKKQEILEERVNVCCEILRVGWFHDLFGSDVNPLATFSVFSKKATPRSHIRILLLNSE